MGCVSSKESTVDQAKLDSDKTREVARQRRRLSLAPEKVGDTTIPTDPNQPAVVADDEIEEDVEAVETKEVLYIRVSHLSKKGFVPYNSKKVNQDRFVVKHGIGDDPGISLFGVMDGHGEFGHLVADFVKHRLPKYLDDQKNLRSDPPRAITEAVLAMCEELRETSINVSFSGTTAVFGVKIDDILYIANIGDSRCVLARSAEDGVIEAVAMTRDQKPDVPEERARIIAAGGRVQPLPGPPDEDRGPDRVWLEKVDVPGLAMSRSIGDEVSQQVGVISIPEITEHRITKDDMFAIWASDGVWEFVSNEDAVATVVQNLHSLSEATRALVNISQKLWRENEEVVDDITTVIVKFHATANEQ